jgi:thioredoxin reductase
MPSLILSHALPRPQVNQFGGPLKVSNLDENAFVMTASSDGDGCVFQTSRPGIYAVGDVRAGSVKRVANAIGEGSVEVSHVHRYIAEQKTVEAERRAVIA